MRFLHRFFDIDGRGTTVTRELRGALATFLTMSYILFANPAILQAAYGQEAERLYESAVAGTALAAGICCLLMGLVANFPLALASGMGLNAVVAYQIVLHVKVPWQTAMGLVVLDGLVILLLVLCGLREAVMNAIPRDLRRAIGAGIGLFIAFIGLVNARLVVVPPGTLAVLQADPAAAMPPVTAGSLLNRDAIVAVVGLLFTAIMLARQVRGAIVLGIVVGTVAALFLGVAALPTELAAPRLDTALQADVLGALRHPQLVTLLLAFLLVDFFDTLGTVTAIAEQAGLQDAQGNVLGLRKVLIVDSVSAAVGGLFGVSSVTCYIESAAGVAEGARTGLHSVVVGLLFLAAVFAAPLARMVPLAATAPALILVGFLMGASLCRIDFTNYETAIPAFVTLITIPLTYSITHGIGFGFILYVAIKVFAGKFREVHPVMYGVAAVFAAYFIWGGGS